MLEMKPFNPKEMEGVIAALESIPGALAAIPTERPTVAAAKAFAGHFASILKAHEEGKQISYNQFCFYPELMYAFDIQPLCPEAWTIIPLVVMPDLAQKHIDVAMDAGVHSELCSADRALIGELLTGNVPAPSFIVTSSQPCDNSRMGYSMVQQMTKAPLFMVDSPYGETEDCIAYYENQIWRLITFLEQQTGKKLDWDKFREVMEESNRATEYILEVNELRKMVPCPSDGKVPTFTFFGNMTLLGHPSLTTMYKTFLDDAKERALQKQGVVPKEKIRAIWFYTMISWDIMAQSRLQQELGHINVMDMFGYLTYRPIDTSTPDKIIRGLAERNHLAIPMGRQGRGFTDVYFDDLFYVYEEWKADCVVLAGHDGCKWLKAATGMLREMCRKKGIPLLFFDVDILDPRVVSGETYRALVEDYLTAVVEPSLLEKK